MESIDRQKAARVWARVHAPAQPVPREELAGLILAETEDAATLERLARSRSGKQADICQQLAARIRSHAACRRGICIASAGPSPELPKPNSPQEPAAPALRRCCGRQMSCLRELEARAAHPEYGPIYAQLALQTRAICQELLTQLGNLPPQMPSPSPAKHRHP